MYYQKLLNDESENKSEGPYDAENHSTNPDMAEAVRLQKQVKNLIQRMIDFHRKKETEFNKESACIIIHEKGDLGIKGKLILDPESGEARELDVFCDELGHITLNQRFNIRGREKTEIERNYRSSSTGRQKIKRVIIDKKTGNMDFEQG